MTQQQTQPTVTPEELEQKLTEADALTDDAERVRAWLRVASQWTDEVGDPAPAIPIYEKILELEPTNVEATRGLEQIYEGQEEWGELAQLLLRHTEHLHDTTEQVDLLVRIAFVYELELDDLENALEIIKLAFQLDYEREDVAGELERLAAASGKWGEIVEEYTAVVHGSEDDPHSQINLANLVARWYAEHLGQPELAVTWCQFVLTKDENNLEALDLFRLLMRQTERWPELITVLDRYARLVRDRREQLDCWLELGELYEEKLSDPTESAKCFSHALTIDNESLEAMEALERIYRMTQQWQPLVEILELRSEKTDDETEKGELRQNIGELWEEQLGDLDKAAECYRTLLEIDPRNTFNLRALERLYTRAENWDALIDVYGLQLEAIENEEQKSEIHVRAAKVWEEQIGNVDQAAKSYESALSLVPYNQECFDALSRIYPRLSRWNDQTDLLRRRIEGAESPEARISWYMALGNILAQRLNDELQSIEVFRSVLELDPKNSLAQEQLATLHEAVGSDDAALEQLRALADEHEDQDRRAEFYFRRGRIHERQQDVDEAISCYEFASRMDESLVPPLQALGQIYRAREEWSNAAGAMEREAERTTDDERRAALCFEAGVIRKDRLADDAGARPLLEKARELDPRSPKIAAALAEIYLSAERWHDAEPLLDILADPSLRGIDASEADRHRWHLQLGQVAAELGKSRKAEQQFRAAFEIDAKDLATLSGLGNLLYEEKRWPEALRFLDTIIEEHRDEQSSSEVVTTYYRLGIIHRELGDEGASLAMFEKALEVNPNHPETRQALIQRYQGEEDWEQVVRSKEALVDSIDDEIPRMDLLLEIGDIWQEKLGNNLKAVEAYEAILAIDPKRRLALSKLMGVFIDARQWQEAVDVIHKIAELEENPVVRAKYYATVGQVQRDELKQIDLSIQSYNKALDDDPTNRRAFDALVRTCVTVEYWSELQDVYARQIKRLEGAEPAELARVWRGLGRLCAGRLNRRGDAILAFETATRLEPKHIDAQQTLAELYAQDMNDADKAVNRYAAVLALEPDRVEAYRALHDVFARSGQADAAWCAARALRYLDSSTEEVDAVYERFLRPSLPMAKAALNEQVWHDNIFHRGENRLLRAIFEVCGPALADSYRMDTRKAGLKRKERIDMKSGKLAITRYLQYSVGALGLQLPGFYHKQGSTGIGFVNDDTPIVVLGDDVVQGQTERALMFMLGRHLTYLRSEYRIIRALGAQLQSEEMLTNMLRTLVYASLAVAAPQIKVPEDVTQGVKTISPELQKSIRGNTLQRLRQVVKAAGSIPDDLDLAEWVAHAERTANRAGLILADDLDAGATIIREDPAIPTSHSSLDRIRDMLRYSVSPGYIKVRNGLGLRVG